MQKVKEVILIALLQEKKQKNRKQTNTTNSKKGAKNMTSTQIELQIANCELQIKKNSNAIRKAENDYESLTGFKQNVITCQSNFSAGNSGKIQALESVSPITHNCNAALRYYKGMKKLVNSSGGKIINVLLERLIVSAQDSMRGYLKKISDLENENDHLRRKIEQLQQELKIAEMNEVLADANK